MSVVTGYAKEPCNGCPWRTDTAMSIDVEEAEKVCGSPERPLMPGDAMMPCHKKYPDADQYLCAGWLALFGWHHIGVRLMIGSGVIPPEALEVNPDWPPLHPDVQSIKEAHG